MSLRQLLNNQTIRIDDHKRGSREIKKWNYSDVDVHIDKITKYKIDGKVQTVRIRIPINSDRQISVIIKGKRNKNIPPKLYKEIQEVLMENPEKVINLADDIMKNINSYDILLDDKQKARDALNKLSKHFELDWTSDEIDTCVNGNLEVLTQIFTDRKHRKYQISMNRKNIIMSDITTKSRHGVSLSKFK